MSHNVVLAFRRQSCVAGGDADQIESSASARAKGAGTARPGSAVRRGLECTTHVDSRRAVGQSLSAEMNMATESWYVWSKS